MWAMMILNVSPPWKLQKLKVVCFRSRTVRLSDVRGRHETLMELKEPYAEERTG
jgi:hypothetical protein